MPPMRFDQPDNFSLTRRRKFTFAKLLRICGSGAVGELNIGVPEGGHAPAHLERIWRFAEELLRMVLCANAESHRQPRTMCQANTRNLRRPGELPRFTSLPEKTSSRRSYLTPKPCQRFPATSYKNYTNLSISGSMPYLAFSLKPVFRNN